MGKQGQRTWPRRPTSAVEKEPRGHRGQGGVPARSAFHKDYPGAHGGKMSAETMSLGAAAASGYEMMRPELRSGAVKTTPDHIFFPKWKETAPTPRGQSVAYNPRSMREASLCFIAPGNVPSSWHGGCPAVWPHSPMEAPPHPDSFLTTGLCPRSTWPTLSSTHPYALRSSGVLLPPAKNSKTSTGVRLGLQSVPALRTLPGSALSV